MQLYPTTENRTPPGLTCLEVLSKGGIRLRAAYAVPASPKGTVVIFGGRAEYLERYFETMNDMLRRGLAVVSFDWRGQGESDRLLPNRLRGHAVDFADFDADVDAVFSRVIIAHCPKPFFGLGHSTGGHLMLRTLRGKKWLERAVLTAPLLGFHFGAWPRPLARGLSFGATRLGLGSAYLPGLSHLPQRREDFDSNALTSDRRRWDRDMSTLEQFPQLAVGGPTFGWLRAALDSIDELMEWPANRGPSCPTLMALAGMDRVVNNAGTKAFLGRAPGFSSLTIADSRHEILNEKTEIRERFLAAFDAFIAA
ncbi:MAG: alpha/beta hydrolase [Alphaproteobacteria bacterium]|nr:alpha/beta hydrolase [Alphaproteobacteria bacterium]